MEWKESIEPTADRTELNCSRLDGLFSGVKTIPSFIWLVSRNSHFPDILRLATTSRDWREHAMNPQRLFPVDIKLSISWFCTCVCVCVYLWSICSTTKKQRREQLYSAWPGCNPSTRIMNSVCVCVCVFSRDGVWASEVIRECFSSQACHEGEKSNDAP